VLRIGLESRQDSKQTRPLTGLTVEVSDSKDVDIATKWGVSSGGAKPCLALDDWTSDHTTGSGCHNEKECSNLHFGIASEFDFVWLV
jgi:hypothetical protein